MNNIVAEGKELLQDKIELKKGYVGSRIAKEVARYGERSGNGRTNKNDAWNYIPSTISVKLGLTPTTVVNSEGINVQARSDTG